MKLSVCCRWPTSAAATLHHRPLANLRATGDQTGVALITVLLIVFLASATATSLAALQQMAIRRSTVLQHQQQARLYTFAIEQWAMLMLARDRKRNQIDHPGEQWATATAVFPIEAGTLSARLRDLQGCFNLNNLWQSSASPPPDPNANAANQENLPSDNSQQHPATPQQQQHASKEGESTTTASPTNEAAQEDSDKAGKPRLNEAQFQVLEHLLHLLELKPELAQAIVDWVDPDQDPLFPNGAEDSDYTILTPSYLAANRPLLSISELRAIKGMDREAYDKLAPLVCALPAGTPLNVNTAPPLVLAALMEGKDPKEIEQLLENRPVDGYKSVDDFLNAATLTVNAQLKAQLSVATQHFLLRAEARVGDGRSVLYSTLHRTKNGVRVLWRSFGNQD